MKKDGVLGKMMMLNKVSVDLYMFGAVREDIIVNNPENTCMVNNTEELEYVGKHSYQQVAHKAK